MAEKSFWDSVTALLNGNGTNDAKLLALMGGGLAALLENINRTPDPIKSPAYTPAPVYNRALTAPITPANSFGTGKLYFNPQPFNFDPATAGTQYGPSQAEIDAAKNRYTAGLASLYDNMPTKQLGAANTPGKQFAANMQTTQGRAPTMMEMMQATKRYAAGGPVYMQNTNGSWGYPTRGAAPALPVTSPPGAGGAGMTYPSPLPGSASAMPSAPSRDWSANRQAHLNSPGRQAYDARVAANNAQLQVGQDGGAFAGPTRYFDQSSMDAEKQAFFNRIRTNATATGQPIPPDAQLEATWNQSSGLKYANPSHRLGVPSASDMDWRTVQGLNGNLYLQAVDTRTDNANYAKPKSTTYRPYDQEFAGLLTSGWTPHGTTTNVGVPNSQGLMSLLRSPEWQAEIARKVTPATRLSNNFQNPLATYANAQPRAQSNALTRAMRRGYAAGGPVFGPGDGGLVAPTMYSGTNAYPTAPSSTPPAADFMRELLAPALATMPPWQQTSSAQNKPYTAAQTALAQKTLTKPSAVPPWSPFDLRPTPPEDTWPEPPQDSPEDAARSRLYSMRYPAQTGIANILAMQQRMPAQMRNAYSQYAKSLRSPSMAAGGPVFGPGDGVSDSIPATINGNQPAALADGEYVLPAHFVSALGNGSTNAGVRQIQNMVDRVMSAKYGTRDATPRPLNPRAAMPV